MRELVFDESFSESYEPRIPSGSNDLIYATMLGLLVFIAVILVINIVTTNGGSVQPGGQPSAQPAELFKGELKDLPEREAVTIGDVKISGGKPVIEVSDEKDPVKDKVIKWKSNIDGEYYYVADSLPDKQRAADTLAEIHMREQYLLQSLDEMMDNGGQIKAADGTDITINMKRLVKKHYGKRTPFAELHSPGDKTVGSNSSKGELIEMCLRNKYNPSEWNPINTIFRVHVHELAHSADKSYREDGDHGPVFNRLMNHLLQVSENLGIYSCSEYQASGRRYCGLKLQPEGESCS